MRKFLSLPTTQVGLFVRKNLAKNSSGLAVEVGLAMEQESKTNLSKQEPRTNKMTELTFLVEET